GVELSVSATREVKGRIAIEGDGPMPSAIGFTFSGPQGAATVRSEVRPDGTFNLMLPEGQRRINVTAGLIPSGYVVTSFTYGSADLLKTPLQIAAGDFPELRVTYDTASTTFEKVSGRVVGAAPRLLAGDVVLSPAPGGVAPLQVP